MNSENQAIDKQIQQYDVVVICFWLIYKSYHASPSSYSFIFELQKIRLQNFYYNQVSIEIAWPPPLLPFSIT